MADTPISALPAATTLAGTEVVPVVQSGATKKATVTQVLAAEAAARAAADALLLAKTGGTLTGALVLPGDAASALQATPLQQVQALIAALVDAAPGTLDTLNELAAALGDDPNFAATLTTLIGTKAADADVVHDTGAETVAGVKTFSSDPIIPDEAYGVGWNGSLEPPTKNAVYDKIETLVLGGGAPTDATYVTLSANGTLSAESVLGSAVNMRGLFADRPAAGIAGREYAATDGTQVKYRDNGSSWDPVSPGLNEPTLQQVAKAGTLIGTRHRLNLIEGSNVTLTVADDGANDEVDITIAAAAGSAGVTVQDEGSPLATAGTTLNFTGAGVTATGTGATKTIDIPGGSGTGMELLGSATLGTQANTMSAITIAARDHLQIVVLLAGYDSADIPTLRFGTPTMDAAANYSDRHLHAVTGAATLTNSESPSATAIRLGSTNSTQVRMIVVNIGNLAAAKKVATIVPATGSANAATASITALVGSGVWHNTTDQITAVQLRSVGANLMAVGTKILIYGKNV